MTRIRRFRSRVARLGELDVVARLMPIMPRWMAELSVALLAIGASMLARLLLDLVAPGGAPFVLVYPAAMLAALLAGWRAGLLTSLVLIGYIKYYSYPVIGSFAPADSAGAFTMVAILIGALLIVVIAAIFRAAVSRATAERDREIADRDLLLAEFDHRMKNNFAIVASILDIQRRRSDGAAAEALGAAFHRVESIARAHRQLYRGDGQGGTVEMREYLTGLCEALADALFLRGGVTLRVECEPVGIDRDRAVSIGLVVNELVTNAAKHAFVDRDAGTIRVAFGPDGDGWKLVIADDGVGMPAEPSEAPKTDSGLGSRLIPAFARQAGGTLVTESDTSGTRVTLLLTA